jgi:hypothetical protein
MSDIVREPVLGGLELWVKDRIAVLMPAVKAHYSARLTAAIERRARANLVGRSECGAEAADGSALAPRLVGMRMVHEDDCDASDEALMPSLRAER